MEKNMAYRKKDGTAFHCIFYEDIQELSIRPLPQNGQSFSAGEKRFNGISTEDDAREIIRKVLGDGDFEDN